MENKEDSLELRRLQDGGYVVRMAYRNDGMYRADLFASTTIEEALKYLKNELKTVTD